MKRQDAKDELLSHARVLGAFAMSLTRNEAAADDLVQETILKAWANMESFQEGSNMRAWLFTILRNAFYSQRRSAHREEPHDAEALQDIRASKPDHDGRLALRDFKRAYDTLPAEQREVLTLIGVMQYSYDEAAAISGVHVGTIKSRLNRGRAALAKAMGLDNTEDLTLTDNITRGVVDTRPRPPR